MEAAPYFSFLGSCIKPDYSDGESAYIYFPLITIIPFIFIAIMTNWKSIFTQEFRRKIYEETLNDNNFTTQKKKDISHIKKLVEIFGLLLVVSNILFTFTLLLGTHFSSTGTFERKFQKCCYIHVCLFSCLLCLQSHHSGMSQKRLDIKFRATVEEVAPCKAFSCCGQHL